MHLKTMSCSALLALALSTVQPTFAEEENLGRACNPINGQELTGRVKVKTGENAQETVDVTIDLAEYFKNPKVVLLDGYTPDDPRMLKCEFGGEGITISHYKFLEKDNCILRGSSVQQSAAIPGRPEMWKCEDGSANCDLVCGVLEATKK